MSTVLYGPFPFDEKVVVASARAALSVVSGLLREGRGDELVQAGATGADPGLYIALDTSESAPRISGFWVTFGSAYTDRGPAGPPDRQPPIAVELLDAATEEVWWKELPVNRTKGGMWRPVIVFEWPPFLASRSALAPPGIPVPFLEEVFDEDADATWLDEVTADLPLPVTEVEVEVEFDDDDDGPRGMTSEAFEDLPLERSVIAVIRGQLEHGRALHKGSFGLVPPGTLGDLRRILPFEEWMAAAAGNVKLANEDAAADDAPRLGGPLALPGGRVGFQAYGWLTRSLEVWPLLASTIRSGTLNDRVVQSRWKQQLAMATSSSIIVLTLVISVAMAIRQAATPRPEASPEPPPPAAQPAMAQCSAEHTQFVEEFRCQVKALSEGGRDALGDAVCEDRSDQAKDPIRPLAAEDLQAAYCGLLDRAEQGWQAKFGVADDAPKSNWAQFAAAQACFNVLGHPYPYELMTYGERKVANPGKFLQDENLRVEPLMQLVTDLEAACTAYRERLEARVEGAIFATHVGDSSQRTVTARRSLRELATSYALDGMPDEIAQCFREGMEAGLEAVEYHRICTGGRGPNDTADREFGELAAGSQAGSKVLIWAKLAGDHLAMGEAQGGLIDRYTRARFGNYLPDETNGIGLRAVEGQVARASELWQCHMMLGERFGPGRPPADNGLGLYQVRIPFPTAYDVSGRGARTQLQLDAGLMAMRDGGLPAGVCWSVVSRRLTQYQPVHPLLAIPDDKSWPSAEQQLCGQICAAYYGVRRSAYEADWATPYGDLDLCVSRELPPTSSSGRDGLGAEGLDQLRIPYHSLAVSTNSYRWITPDHSDVCAFNLIAQGQMPGTAEGYIVGARAPEQWAGSTSEGSGIAGNPRQAIELVRAAYRPGSGGRSGVEVCGDVATQCFTSLMLEVINPRLEGDERVQRYEYLSAWQSRVRSVAGLAEGAIREQHPWCAAIFPYLLPQQAGARTGTTDIDEPCRRGVEAARERAVAAINHIAVDNTEVERQ